MDKKNDKPKVLIVDDNPNNLQVLGSLLTIHEFQTTAVQSGRQALEVLKTSIPELILLDIMMPEMDGFEVCERIKSDPATENIPVLFITALSDIENKKRAFAVGGADFISKPFVKEEVIVRINVHLQKSRYLKQVTETNHHLKEVIELKDRFLAIAAHDIRSPLGGANGLVELILENELGEVNEQQRELLQLVLKTGHQIMHLVSDLLDISVIESGNLKLNFSEISLSKLIADRIRLHQISVKRKNIKIVSKLVEGPQINADEERLGQVLDNLLTNAAKFSPKNTSIIVSLDYQESTAIMKVIDQGPGISSEDQSQLFGVYRKLTAKPTSGEKSSGLGLAIVQKIIEGHQGSISVKSKMGKGATFIVRLPQ